MTTRSSRLRLIGYGWLGLLLDQASKYMARQALIDGPIDLGWFQLTLIYNTGAAYGLFSNHTLILTGLGVVAIAYLIIWSPPLIKHPYDLMAYACILGGAVGNTLDRLVFGHVTDFINIHIIPVFNVADTLLNIGIIILVYQWLVHERKQSH
ncbi:MAG: signal peptidase II [Candidatus Marinamargulisbacteria bacterium]